MSKWPGSKSPSVTLHPNPVSPLQEEGVLSQ